MGSFKRPREKPEIPTSRYNLRSQNIHLSNLRLQFPYEDDQHVTKIPPSKKVKREKKIWWVNKNGATQEITDEEMQMFVDFGTAPKNVVSIFFF
jgi:hypothetical protein